MELQQLTEQMLLAVTSLNRSCIPQSVQEPLKGENFLLDYLSAQNGCSTPGALREVLGVSAPLYRLLRPAACRGAHDRSRPTNGGTGACVAVRACAVRAQAAWRAGCTGADPASGPHHGDRGRRLSRGCARI